jgi:ferrous iron transport protein B
MTCHAPTELLDTAGTAPVILIGNPNVGKSALFGALTGRYATVSNYPGTTVEVTQGWLAGAAPQRTVIDTPGLYSLTPLSDDERVTRDILLDRQPAAVVQVADAKNLRRSLLIAVELAETGIPFVLAVNMMDEAAARGIEIDAAVLSARLGVPAVTTVATRKDGLRALLDTLHQAQPGCLEMRYSPPMEAAVAAVEGLLPQATPHKRSTALMVLSGADDLLARLHVPAAEQAAIRAVRSQAEAELRQPLAVAINRERIVAVDAILADAVRVRPAGRPWSDRLGRWAVEPLLGWPVLAAVLYAVYLFVGVFGAGTLVGLLEENFFGAIVNPWLTGLVETLIPFPLVQSFLVGEFGLFTMALTYAFAIVLPIVGTFFLAFSVLEDSGYLPRLAVMLDRAFRTMGLNGKAVLPMILGLGCDTMATMATRILDSRKERIQVTLLLALGVPCSAQLGVLLGMVGGLGLWALAVWGGVVVATMLVVGWLAARVIPGKQSDFILELPPLRLPEWRNVVIKTLARMEWYLKEVVPIFVLGTALLFALDLFGALAWIQQALAPLVVGWLGLPIAATDALLVGFLRRDYGAAGLFNLAQQGLLDPVQIVVSMVVITLFVPCIANFLMIVKEYGPRIGIAVAATVFPLALLVGGVLNVVLSWVL